VIADFFKMMAMNGKAKSIYKLAKEGDPMSQNSLGDCYLNGDGVSKDSNEAFSWYLKAAQQGNSTAQYSLGLCFEKGVGVTKNQTSAAEWYQKAANQGQAVAHCNRG